MKTLKEDLQEVLAEMQATANKFEELMNTPGIKWPELNNDYGVGDVVIALDGIKDDTEHFKPGERLLVRHVDDNPGLSVECTSYDGAVRWVNKKHIKKYI